MTIRRGANLFELLPTAVAGVLPDPWLEQLGFLTVVDHQASMSAGATVHRGALQALADSLDINTQSWWIRIPGLTTGLRFQLTIFRGQPSGPTPGAAGVPFTAEGASTGWQLDILVGDCEVKLPGLRAAKRIEGSGASATHLEPAAPPADVWFIVSGAIQITSIGGAGPVVNLIDSPDPLDPAAPNGAVLRVTAQPPHFLFGGSQVGASLDRVILDLSPTYTPPEIAARHHGEGWMGIMLREATFFLPPDTPKVGSLSFGVRDLILGDPFGLQGEAVIEMGQDSGLWSLGDARVHDEEGTEIGVITQSGTLTFTGGARPIKIRWSAPPPSKDRQVAGVWYRLPDGSEGALDAANAPMVSPLFDLPTSGELRYRVRVAAAGNGVPAPAAPNAAQPGAVPAGQAELAEVKVSFVLNANPDPLQVAINVTINGVEFVDVAFVRGPRQAIQGMTLVAAWAGGGVSDLVHKTEWKVGGGSAPIGSRTPGDTYVLTQLPDQLDSFDVIADVPGPAPDQPGDRRRVRVQIAGADLIVGRVGGPVNASNVPIQVDRVVATELLETFHVDGKLTPAAASATVTGGAVSVPAGTIAEVELNSGGVQGDHGPRGIHLMMEFDATTVTRVRHTYETPPVPAHAAHPVNARGLAYPLRSPPADQPAPVGDTVAQIQAWVERLPPAQDRIYFVVARTDDLCQHANLQENDAYNLGLAKKRLDAALVHLEAAGVPAGQIRARTEQEDWVGLTQAEQTLLGDAPARLAAGGNPPARLLPPNAPLDPSQSPRYYSAELGANDFSPDSNDPATHNKAVDDDRRFPYRTVEVWAAATGVSNDPAPSMPPTGGSFRVLVPGVDGPAPVPPVSLEQSPPIDWRLRLRAKWDSPTVISGDDAVPVEAEALLAWEKKPIALPAGQSPATPADDGRTYWEALARFAYDARTGITEVTGSLALPDGTLTISSDALAGAMALAPALGSLIDPGNAVSDPGGHFLQCAAILAVGAAIGEAINTDPAVPSTVDLRRFELRYRWDSESNLRAALDYAVDLKVNFDIPSGAKIRGSVKLHYKNVGVAFSWDATGLQGVGLAYDAVSIEVQDMGSWSIDGPLGKLIRVAASRFGRGSTWMEFDLELALDLGVVRLEGATIRIYLDPSFGLELRGMKVGVSIENVLDGSGSLELGDGGAVRAGLAVDIIPAKLGAAGALAIDGPMVAVEFKVQLPVGIPLANSGLAIFGFIGRFVANGARNLAGLDNPDPAMRELAWFTRDFTQKYAPHQGQYAVGLGAVIGTLPDNGFSFNAEGSLCVGFPDLSIIFGIDAKLASERKAAASEDGDGSDTDFKGRIIGLAVIESTSVSIAIKADFTVPKLLELMVPISGYFPATGDPKWYLRIGTDNGPGRPGSPITLRIFPDDFDLQAWAFFMFEGDGLPGLGGSLVDVLGDKIDLGGFAIGFGAGFEIHWEAGPISVDLSASLLVGLGTRPLLVAAHLQMSGEISIEIISVEAYGYVDARILDGELEAHAHVCGKVDLLFDTVEGCIDIDINNGATDVIPPPGPPVLGVDLCDHLAAVKGKAVAPGAALPTVWPDTVAAIHFSHPVVVGLPAEPLAVLVSQPPSDSYWFGSSELKYAYKLTAVEVWRLDAASNTWSMVDGPIDAAWWLPTHRAALVTGDDDQPEPSAEEGRELGLFWWHPFPWARWLSEENDVIPGYPTETLEEICTPAPPATRACAFGRDAVPLAPMRAALSSQPDADAAFPSKFSAEVGIPSTLDVELLVAKLLNLGGALEPGGLTAISPPPLSCCGEQLSSVWALPAVSRAGSLLVTLPVEVKPSPSLISPEIHLLACIESGRSETTPWVPRADVCDVFDTSTTLTGGVSASGVRYVGSYQANTDGSLSVLGDLQARFPSAVDVVSIVAHTGRGVTVIATDARGGVVASVGMASGERATVELHGRGIAAVTMQAVEGFTLFEVCRGVDLAAAATDAVDPATTPAGGLPVVIGHRADGSALSLPGAIVSWRDENGHRCMLLRYVAPGALWQRFTIAPWTNGRIGLVSLCGITETAVIWQGEDQELRDDLVNLFTGGPGSAVAPVPRPIRLDPATTYEIRIRWRWQGWTPAFPGQKPPAPSDAWRGQSGSVNGPDLEERYRFQTAAWGVQPPVPAGAPPSAPYPEDVFDPRGLERYLMRMLPIHTDAPHFVGDSLGAWFRIDHLAELLGKYGRELKLRVRRTDPGVGEAGVNGVDLSLLEVPIEVASQISVAPWFPVEADVGALLETLPCVGNPGYFGGSAVTAAAGLRPRAEYDLLLVAHLQGAGDEVIARSHFRTSRYVDAYALIRGLGLGMSVMNDFVAAPPDDALIAQPLPQGPLYGDEAFDGALRTIGIDPWPLPSGGRTTLLWREVPAGSDSWRLEGVLFESDEPIHRARPKIGYVDEPAPVNRLAVAGVKVLAGAATALTFEERARNAAGTRILWAAVAPAGLTPAVRYTLSVTFEDNGTPVAAHAPLFDCPVIVAQEAE